VTKQQSAVITDLDGSLICNDSFLDTIAVLAVRQPLMAIRIAAWLCKGRARCKARISAIAPVNPATQVFDPDVLAILQEARALNAQIVLATASHISTAESIATHLGMFDAVLATHGALNLKGERKLEAVRRWCEQNAIKDFTYIGDSHADIPLWRHASTPVAVRPSASVARALMKLGKPTTTVGNRPARIPTLIRAMRPHQWVKNLLVFVPMVLGQEFTLPAFMHAAVAFGCFSACASAVYLLNDVLDLEADRRHPTKRLRPIASGALSAVDALLAAGVLVAAGLTVAWALIPDCVWLLSGYLGANYAYSRWLKTRPLVDVIMLAGMYGLRLEIGGVATSTVLSPWLLAFALFFFTSLAFAKRLVELQRLMAAGGQQITGRGYLSDDFSMVATFGPAAGYVAILVLALYMNSPQMTEHYGDSRLLWLLCPLMMYWITRVWLLANRGVLDDDPVVFAFKDRGSLAVAAAAAAIIAAAIARSHL
jgi:4-hydroxybenzoate polyprenyltransferase/phosphoserine phosphatase